MSSSTSTSTTTGGGRFQDVPLLPPDSIIDLNRQIKADTNPHKVDLGIGAYRDSKGKPYILNVVKKAEARVVADPTYNHEYIPIEGLASFREGAQKVLFGEKHPVVTEGRVATVQALSGTGSLRVGMEFLSRQKMMGGNTHTHTHTHAQGSSSSSNVVYLPNQTWANHHKLARDAGITDIRTYRYYDAKTLSLDFQGMIEDLQQAPAGAIVLLHPSGHNPVGFDPSMEEWQRLASVCVEKELFPFFDNAYQGYTSGSLEEDAYSVRLFASLGMEFFVACSFAKNMGLYGERIGALHACVKTPTEASVLVSQFQAIIRPMYSSPPGHYARVAGLILNDPVLMEEWQVELRAMAGRIQKMRALFLEALATHACPGSWAHIGKQKGMFGFTGLTRDHVSLLKMQNSIYMLDNGRISLSGFNENNVDYVAKAITEVLTKERELLIPREVPSGNGVVGVGPAAGEASFISMQVVGTPQHAHP